MGGQISDTTTVVTDTKRKRVEKEMNQEINKENNLVIDGLDELKNLVPKNLIEAKPVVQACLSQ